MIDRARGDRGETTPEEVPAREADAPSDEKTRCGRRGRAYNGQQYACALEVGHDGRCSSGYYDLEIEGREES